MFVSSIKFIHLCVQPELIKHLLFARSCPRHGETAVNKTDKNPHLDEAYLLLGKQMIIRINKQQVCLILDGDKL